MSDFFFGGVMMIWDYITIHEKLEHSQFLNKMSKIQTKIDLDPWLTQIRFMNFTNKHFQKGPIPHLTRTMK